MNKLRNREVRWQFQASLRSRYNMVRQTVGKDMEVAWEELKEGILRSLMRGPAKGSMEESVIGGCSGDDQRDGVL